MPHTTTETFFWNKQDQLTIYRQADESHKPILFSIDSNYDESTHSNSAGFYTMSNDLLEGDQFVALYPNVNNVAISNNMFTLGAFYFSIPVENDEIDWTSYLKKYMYMYATATAQSAGTNLEFNHLTAMARVTYYNDTDTEQEIERIDLIGNNNKIIAGRASFDLSNQQLEPAEESSIAINLSKKKVVPVGKSCDFYILFFPGLEEFAPDGSITIKVNYNIPIDINTSEISAANNGATRFEAGKRYWFKISQQSDGIHWKNENQFVKFEDEDFKTFVVNQYDSDGDGEISFQEALEITSIFCSNSNFSSLKGVEHFANLEFLSCDNNNLTELDLSGCTNLKSLNCYNSQLTTLNLSDCTNLFRLDCYDNQLTTLNLSGCTSLKILYCENNQLTELNLSGLTALTNLQCTNNNLTTLTLANNAARAGQSLPLQYLYCDSNQLSELNLSGCTELNTISCSSNLLTALDLTDLTQIGH